MQEPLRRPSESDGALLFSYVYRTRVVEQLAWDGPQSELAFQPEWAQIVQEAEQGLNHFFVIVDDVSGCPAGACSVRCEGRVGDLGIWLGEPYQGRGLGTRAIVELVRYSLERPDLKRLEATIFDENWPSRRQG